MYICNDPWICNGQTADVFITTPAFRDERLISSETWGESISALHRPLAPGVLDHGGAFLSWPSSRARGMEFGNGCHTLTPSASIVSSDRREEDGTCLLLMAVTSP